MNWKDAVSDMKNHAVLNYHKQSMARMNGFLETQKNPAKRVDTSMNDKSKEIIEKNKSFLKSIIKCIEFCGRQGLAIRGHRDSGSYGAHDKLENEGNFKTLLNFIDSGDKDLENHLLSSKKNASYISNTCQNDLLICIKEYIQSAIISQIKQQDFGPLYGLQADEVTDTSNWEQLGIVLRYLVNDQPVEKLVEFVACDSTTCEEICKRIVDSLRNLNLQPENCRAQTYDGAGNMSGKQKGCATRFQQLSPRALYCHCSSHDLNLALSHNCSVPEIHCMLSAIKSVGIFFKFSPKRSRELEDTIAKFNENYVLKIKKSKVKVLCETRWVERHTSLEDFNIMYPALLECFQGIADKSVDRDWDSKTVTEASGILSQITSVKFIAAFQCAIFLFGFTKALSILLQGSTMDVVTAYQEINLIKEEFQSIRDNADKEFGPIYNDMNKMIKATGVEKMSILRRCSRQTLRGNIEGNDPEIYWRQTIFIPYLDNLITQMNLRFSQISIQGILGLCLIPQNLLNLSEERIAYVKDFYAVDLPAPTSYGQEIRLWKRIWESEDTKPATLTETLVRVNSKQFPNITRIMRLLLLQSATSATTERANSSLKLIKTSLRSTMKEDRLNALILLHIHRDIELDYETIITMYASIHPRRMLFLHPMTDK